MLLSASYLNDLLAVQASFHQYYILWINIEKRVV